MLPLVYTANLTVLRHLYSKCDSSRNTHRSGYIYVIYVYYVYMHMHVYMNIRCVTNAWIYSYATYVANFDRGVSRISVSNIKYVDASNRNTGQYRI